MSKFTAFGKSKKTKLQTAFILGLMIAFASTALIKNQKVAAVGELKIQYRYGDTGTDTKIKPEMKLVNPTTSAISLANVKIRYWFTADDAVAPSIFCDFATVGCANLTQSIVSVSPARTNADRYLEIGFTSAAGSIAGGA